MTDPIQSALTPEQWKHGQRGGPAATDEIRVEGDSIVIVRDSPEYVNDVVRVSDPREYHVLAALTLYGQPFGFTWEDVDEVRAWADYAENGPRAERLASLADRIAALLPPRQ